VAIPDDAVLVVRGNELDPDVLRADAVRFRRRFGQWGRYGVSAFAAADDAEVDALCETRLGRFETVAIFRRSDLVARGIEIVPTFRRPHVTLAHTNLEALVNELRSCDHRGLTNPHFER
jgi:hypothetical protein